jgi:choloylglycine hydrolase
MQSKVIIIPAGKEMTGTLPDGGKGLTYTTRYAIVGANATLIPSRTTGMLSVQGLSVGLFYFPGYASYTPLTAENAGHAIAPHEFGSGCSPTSPRSMR